MKHKLLKHELPLFGVTALGFKASGCRSSGLGSAVETASGLRDQITPPQRPPPQKFQHRRSTAELGFRA